MESEKAQSCLKTFLEVSQLRINELKKEIEKNNKKKRYRDSSTASKINKTIEGLTKDKLRTQGRLDSVKMEMLDMIEADPSLISRRLITKKGYSSVPEFVAGERNNIELRGLYQQYPCSIKDVLDMGLSAPSEPNFSLFDEKQKEATSEDVRSAVSEKNVKVLTRTM